MADKLWQSAPQSAPQTEGLMNYWPDGLLPLEIDDLGLLTSAPQGPSEPAEAPQTLQPSIADEAVLRKRKRDRAEQESVESILAQLGRDEDDDSPFEDKRPARTGSGAKATAASAARNKACRERQRRERLNDRFAELAKVLEPGKAAKTDKTNIIDDAMRIVTQLRGENGQLRQLNKFLEERVAQCEKAKSELLLQQALMQQSTGLGAGPSQLLANARLFQPSHLGPGVVQGFAVGVPAMKTQQPGQQMHPPQQQGQQLQQQVQQPQMTHTVSGQLPGQLQAQPAQQDQQQGQQDQHQQQVQQSGLQSHGSMPQSLQLQLSNPASVALSQQQPQHMGSIPASEAAVPFPNPAFSIKQEYPSGLMLPGGLQFAPNLASWLPPSTLDTSQDSMRRPPAA